MYTEINSGTIVGVEGCLIRIEVDVSEGFPKMDVVGLPDHAVKESVERVRTAIKNSGFSFPYKRITVNLSPADIRKAGPGFDLPIAIGILVCMNEIDGKQLEKSMFVGELSLSGEIRRVNGVLPIVTLGHQENMDYCYIPVENVTEGKLVSDIEVRGVSSLQELVAFLKWDAARNSADGGQEAPFWEPQIVDKNSEAEQCKWNVSEEEAIKDDFEMSGSESKIDFADVRGQYSVKRALEVAAAGGHNLIIVGPPGSGKTMLASCMPTILPEANFREQLEMTKIYSVAGKLRKHTGLIRIRPFRAPHNGITKSALIGGGSIPKPGEISLAHLGVLFLDELTEFKSETLENLRQPLEEGTVTIGRAAGNVTFPARFMLIAAMNPCPCGYYPDVEKCTCTPTQIQKYLSRISGPLLDRIDIQIEAPKVKLEALRDTNHEETSYEIRKRVTAARLMQNKRYQNLGISTNSDLTIQWLKIFCPIDEMSQRLLDNAFNQLGLSARAYHRILKISRTLADLEGVDNIQIHHVAEAIQYRTLDRKYWSGASYQFSSFNSN